MTPFNSLRNPTLCRSAPHLDLLSAVDFERLEYRSPSRHMPIDDGGPALILARNELIQHFGLAPTRGSAERYFA